MQPSLLIKAWIISSWLDFSPYIAFCYLHVDWTYIRYILKLHIQQIQAEQLVLEHPYHCLQCSAMSTQTFTLNGVRDHLKAKYVCSPLLMVAVLLILEVRHGIKRSLHVHYKAAVTE